jgi:hypothetical protein
MTRFFRDGREIGFDEALATLTSGVRAPEDCEDVEDVVTICKNVLELAGMGGHDEQWLLADLFGISVSDMIGFGDDNDPPPLDPEPLFRAI